LSVIVGAAGVVVDVLPDHRMTSSEFDAGVKLAVVTVPEVVVATDGEEASIASATTRLPRPQSAAVICPADMNCSTVVTNHGDAAICAAVTVRVASFRVDRSNTFVAVSGVPFAPSPTTIFVQRQSAARHTTAFVIARVALLKLIVTCTA
jgi:hypothetical protein